jgi:hypothetical protein
LFFLAPVPCSVHHGTIAALVVTEDVMQKWLAFSAVCVATALVAGTGQSQDKKGQPKKQPAIEDNTPPKDFKLLFNGKNLDGWQGLIPLPQRMKLSPDELAAKQKAANEKMLQHWTVKDGILMYDGKDDNLQTAKDYGNFELWVDWKIGPKGDSGIYLRGNPQVQIWDNKDGSGGLFNNKKNPKDPLVVADNPVGQWNNFIIRMVGDKVTVHLNGRLVVDNVPLENYWQKDQPLPKVGPIELQHHGDPLWFKNIYIKELPN